jgi:hypothetical protein
MKVPRDSGQCALAKRETESVGTAVDIKSHKLTQHTKDNAIDIRSSSPPSRESQIVKILRTARQISVLGPGALYQN